MNPNLAGKTILIAEDEFSIKALLTRMFRQWGARVLAVSDGESAFKLACEERPDVIFVDERMPLCSGLELCQRLADNDATAKIPVYIVTAFAHTYSPDEPMPANVRDVINKPFSPRQLGKLAAQTAAA